MGAAAENPWTAIALGGLTAGAVCLGLLWPLDATAVGARAGVETAIALSAILSLCLLGARFRRTRQIDDLLAVGVVASAAVYELVFATLPAVAGLNVAPSASARPAAMAVAVAVAGLAVAPRSARAHWPWPTRPTWPTVGLAPGQRQGPTGVQIWLLAAGCLLLASAGLHGWAGSGPAAGRFTPGDGLRLAAYGVVLAVALRRHDEMRRTVAAQALIEERRRLARDLHDGLAQDLAFIAFSAQRLEPDLGPENPLLIAARRALGTSRGLIADLAARSAPTTAAALGVVGDELGVRFDVRVEVSTTGATAPDGRADLRPAEREEVVLIAREAIINAASHGDARRIDVTLDLDGKRPLLLVSDDGGGVTSSQPHRVGGLGLPTMRARAESLGGRLVLRAGADGGTDLEVRVRASGAGGESGPAGADHARTKVVSGSGNPLAGSSAVTRSSSIAARSSRGS